MTLGDLIDYLAGCHFMSYQISVAHTDRERRKQRRKEGRKEKREGEGAGGGDGEGGNETPFAS